jgi:hypothetical protein
MTHVGPQRHGGGGGILCINVLALPACVLAEQYVLVYSSCSCYRKLTCIRTVCSFLYWTHRLPAATAGD